MYNNKVGTVTLCFLSALCLLVLWVIVQNDRRNDALVLIQANQVKLQVEQALSTATLAQILATEMESLDLQRRRTAAEVDQ